MLYDDIKRENLEAMKRRDSVARAIYSVLIGKLDLVKVAKREKGEKLNDADCVSVIQKTLKELEDEKSNYAKVNNAQKVEDIGKQEEYAKAFLPKMLTEEEVTSIISSLEDKSIPSVMRHFKANYAGKCDMGVVSKIAKSFN